MGIREITGYIAHVLLGIYLVWTISRTAPQLRRSSRDRGVRLRILLIKTAAVAVGAVVVGVIHFWATQWWHVIVAVVAAVLIGVVLNRAYRRHVAIPRHRLTLMARTATTGRRGRHKSDPGHDQAGLRPDGTMWHTGTGGPPRHLTAVDAPRSAPPRVRQPDRAALSD